MEEVGVGGSSPFVAAGVAPEFAPFLFAGFYNQHQCCSQVKWKQKTLPYCPLWVSSWDWPCSFVMESAGSHWTVPERALVVVARWWGRVVVAFAGVVEGSGP